MIPPLKLFQNGWIKCCRLSQVCFVVYSIAFWLVYFFQLYVVFGSMASISKVWDENEGHGEKQQQYSVKMLAMIVCVTEHSSTGKTLILLKY